MSAEKLFSPFRGRMIELIQAIESQNDHKTPEERQAFEAIREAAILLDEKLPANMTFLVHATTKQGADVFLSSANPVFVLHLLVDLSRRWKSHLIKIKTMFKPQGSA